MNAFDIAINESIATKGSLTELRRLINKLEYATSIEAMYLYILAVYNQLTRFKARPSYTTVHRMRHKAECLVTEKFLLWKTTAIPEDTISNLFNLVMGRQQHSISINISQNIESNDDTLELLHKLDNSKINNIYIRLYIPSTSHSTPITISGIGYVNAPILQFKYFEKYGVNSPLIKTKPLDQTKLTVAQDLLDLIGKANDHCTNK